MSVLLLNAGLSGRDGNSQVVVSHAAQSLQRLGVAHEIVVLREASLPDVTAALSRAERLVLVTGTYWGACSSLLQAVLEQLTPSEGTSLWLGKPACVLVTAHQVGAQSVLFRLQGVLSTYGCSIPPMSGVVISKLGEALRRTAPELCRDVWGLDDVSTALHNLLATPLLPHAFRSWPVDSEHYAERWLEPA